MKAQANSNNSISILTIAKVSFTIVGTLIGAGFASGKEITTFFGCYGSLSYLLITIFCIVFALGINYLSSIDPDTIPPILKKLMNIAVFISELISVTAMMAGLASILSLVFFNDIPLYLFLFLIFMIIISGIKGLTTTNLILVPILFGSIVAFGIIGATNINTFSLATINSSSIFKFTSLPLYIGLNLFSIFPIAMEFSKIQNRKEKIASSISASAIIFILMLCFCFTILNKDSTSITSELPLVIYILNVAPNLIIVVVMTLAIAITTTIISDGFVIRGILSKKGNKFANITFAIIFILAFFISKFGFSEIVENLYPINGLLGLILITMVIVYSVKQNNNRFVLIKNSN